MRFAEVVNLKKVTRPCVLHKRRVLLCLFQTPYLMPAGQVHVTIVVIIIIIIIVIVIIIIADTGGVPTGEG